MGEASYLTAAIPKTFTILGQRLEPFSLGHMMLLVRLENGFALGVKEPSLEDLIMGVFVCAHPYAEAVQAFQAPDLAETLEQWGGQVGLFDIPAKSELFLEYLLEGSTQPELLPANGDGRAPGASFLQLLYLFLIEKLRLNTEEALSYGFGQAKHDFFAWHEMAGSAKILNEEERESLTDAYSDEMLERCLAALPGSVPIQPQPESEAAAEPSRNPGKARKAKAKRRRAKGGG